MSKATTNPKPESTVRTLMVQRRSAAKLSDLAKTRGMKIYRAFDLVLAGWDVLTEEQQIEAQRRLSRELQTA